MKIEISLQEENPKEALKIFENIKKVKFYTFDFQNKVVALEQYVLYKTENDDIMKKYYLASYYHCIGEDLKSIRTLQLAVSNKKKYNKLIYGLMSEVYYSQKEFEKAQNFAEKSIQFGGNDYYATMTLGKLSYNNKDYKNAIKYFKSINSSKNNDALVWLAMSYEADGSSKQAKDVYLKILKDKSDCSEAYLNIALSDNNRVMEYLKKSVATKINYVDAWVELAKVSIMRNDLISASKYLDIVKYIDENDFRYYYYQGLIFKTKGFKQEAEYYFRRSLAINPDNESAKKELGI